jgi:hypothetical protein
MAKYRTRVQEVDANKWTKNGDHPQDGVGEQLQNPDGTPMVDESGNPMLRTAGKIVAPYTVPVDDDNDPIEYRCGACGSGMGAHGVLQVGPDTGTIVCPNSWIVEPKGGIFYVFKNRAFNLRYVAV